MVKTITEVLKNLDDLFDSPSKWTKYTAAKNAYKREVSVHDDTAISWCLSGGLEKVCPCSSSELYLQNGAYVILKKFIPSSKDGAWFYLSEYNDNVNTSFQDIKNLLAKAIKFMEEENVKV